MQISLRERLKYLPKQNSSERKALCQTSAITIAQGAALAAGRPSLEWRVQKILKDWGVPPDYDLQYLAYFSAGNLIPDSREESLAILYRGLIEPFARMQEAELHAAAGRKEDDHGHDA